MLLLAIVVLWLNGVFVDNRPIAEFTNESQITTEATAGNADGDRSRVIAWADGIDIRGM